VEDSVKCPTGDMGFRSESVDKVGYLSGKETIAGVDPLQYEIDGGSKRSRRVQETSGSGRHHRDKESKPDARAGQRGRETRIMIQHGEVAGGKRPRLCRKARSVYGDRGCCQFSCLAKAKVASLTKRASVVRLTHVSANAVRALPRDRP